MISATQNRIQAEVNRQTQLSSEIAKLQTDISTGVRIQTASDDPAAAARVAGIRQQQADQAGWAANVQTAAAAASAADGVMTNVATAVTRAQELLIQARSSTLSASDRTAIATELNGLSADVQSYAAQTDASGQPLFPTAALAVPVGDGSAIAATPSHADVFAIATTTGTTDLAAMLGKAATAVSAGSSGIADSLTGIGTAITQVADARAAQGVRASRINDAGTRLTASQTALTSERSGLESTDVTQTVADLQSKMTTLQAAQAVLVKLSKSNLFDMIN